MLVAAMPRTGRRPRTAGAAAGTRRDAHPPRPPLRASRSISWSVSPGITGASIAPTGTPAGVSSRMTRNRAAREAARGSSVRLMRVVEAREAHVHRDEPAPPARTSRSRSRRISAPLVITSADGAARAAVRAPRASNASALGGLVRVGVAADVHHLAHVAAARRSPFRAALPAPACERCASRNRGPGSGSGRREPAARSSRCSRARNPGTG